MSSARMYVFSFVNYQLSIFDNSNCHEWMDLNFDIGYSLLCESRLCSILEDIAFYLFHTPYCLSPYLPTPLFKLRQNEMNITCTQSVDTYLYLHLPAITVSVILYYRPAKTRTHRNTPLSGCVVMTSLSSQHLFFYTATTITLLTLLQLNGLQFCWLVLTGFSVC